jgi:capsular polysaccharide biosynthesis protein
VSQIYKKLLKEGKPILLGFNPVEIKKKSSDMEVERLAIEQALKRPNGVEIIENPYILKDPVNPNIKKNIVLAGITSLFAGILAAFFVEYVKKRIKIK